MTLPNAQRLGKAPYLRIATEESFCPSERAKHIMLAQIHCFHA